MGNNVELARLLSIEDTEPFGNYHGVTVGIGGSLKPPLPLADLISRVKAQIAPPLCVYDFGPDGLVFAEDCTLLLDTRLPEGTVLNLYWFNPDTGEWEVEQRGEADQKGIVKFQIHHFSKYAIS